MGLPFGLTGLARRLSALLAGSGTSAIALLCAANAQAINGTPGAPNATVTVDGRVLPPRDERLCPGAF
jgi:hypothetical protein